MFEGKPPFPEDPSREVLRPLQWAELASRLAAARDLRASLREGGKGGDASFDAGSARWIAAHRDDKDRVNPEDLANRKGDWDNGSDAPPSGSGAARE